MVSGQEMLHWLINPIPKKCSLAKAKSDKAETQQQSQIKYPQVKLLKGRLL